MIKSNGTLFFLFLVVYQFLFSWLLFVVRDYIPAAIFHSPFFIILLMAFMFLVPLGIWLAMKNERLSTHMPKAKLGCANIFLVLGISFFMLPFMMLIASITTIFTPNVAANFMEQTQAHSIWVMLLAIAVTPAVVEEVVFRGFIQAQYPGWPFWRVAVMNGLLFGLIHMNFSQFFYAFFMGIAFAYMVHITRSLWAAIISHFFMNGFNVVMFRALSWMDDNFGGTMESYETVEIAPLDAVIAMGILALGALPFVIALWYVFVRYNRRRFAIQIHKETCV